MLRFLSVLALLAPLISGKPGAIRGAVMSVSGEPLRKATITVTSRGRNAAATFAVTTDATGVYAVEGVPAGSYSIIVRRVGYVQGIYGPKGSPASLDVADGQEVTAVNFRLTPQAVISGKVVDEDGDPVQYASVQVVREKWQNGRKQHVPLGSDNTNDLGEYRISNLLPGSYFLMVNSGRQNPDRTNLVRPQGQAGDLMYTALFYPGVTDVGQAARVQLTAGQDMRGIDLQLRRTTTWRIRGKVLDEAGKPVNYVGVMAVPADGSFSGVRSMGMVRNPDGAFEISGLPSGSYTLMVNRAGRDEPRTTARTVVQLGSRDMDGVIVQLQRTFEISGIVRVIGDGVTLNSARVSVEPLESGLPFYSGNDNRVKPDGTWSVSGLSPGRYRISLNSIPAGAYLKSVTVGGQDITAGASISAGATGIEINLAAKPAEVAGTVLNADKQPVPGSTVVLVPESSKLDQYWLFKRVTSDEAGAFSFQGIVPGQYTAYALGEVEEGIWYSPDFLKTLEGKGIAVKVDEGAHETVSLNPAS